MRCICSYCKMLYDVKEPFNDDGESHGICNECYPIVFGNLEKEIHEIKESGETRKEEWSDEDK